MTNQEFRKFLIPRRNGFAPSLYTTLHSLVSGKRYNRTSRSFCCCRYLSLLRVMIYPWVLSRHTTS